jgi:predicted Zn-dependent protease
MPMLPPVLSRAQQEPWEATHPMNHVKIAQLEHQAHPVPHRAKPAIKESLMVKVVVRVEIVWNKCFKTKVLVHCARIAQQDGCNQTKVPLPVSV